MGQTYKKISDKMQGWIAKQHLYFVATAPSGDEGHINLSPKGNMTTFAVIDPNRVAYIDMTGSGIETVAHLRDNGRICVMFCAFEGPPKIVRLHGQGRVVQRHDPDFAELLGHFTVTDEVEPLIRAVIDIDVTRVSDSCGFVVPKMKFEGERNQLYRWGEAETADDPNFIDHYIEANLAESIDGLKGLDVPDTLTEEEKAKLSHVGRAL
jgi:hypothetical protein